MDKIIECVPNFSEGRRAEVIEKIVDAFRGREGIKLLDYTSDKDHNRSVITALGEPNALKKAALDMVRRALECIDLRQHEGKHPRMGAVDVMPFIPVKGVSVEETIELSIDVAREIGKQGIPVYLYDKSALIKEHENLADCRKGNFEGLNQKMMQPIWKPDFGPKRPHESFGAIAVGCRKFLCAYNINLDSSDLAAAKTIAGIIREKGGGLKCCKALGIELKSRSLAQVSMNLTDYEVTGMLDAYKAVEREAEKLGIKVLSSEIIGLIPKAALQGARPEQLKIENYSPEKILENRL